MWAALAACCIGSTASASGWETHVNPSKTRTNIELEAESDVHAYPDVVSRPVLVASCVSKRLTVYIRTPGLRPELNADQFDSFMARTRQQLDDDEPTNEFMRKDIMEETLHFRKARPALRMLTEHHKFTFAFQPFGSEAVETTFDLSGLAEAAQGLGCKL